MSRIIVPQRRVWTRKPQRVVAALNPQDAAYAAGGVLASGSSYLPTFSGAARLSGGCLILPSIGSYVEFPHGAIPITQDFTITLTFRTGASLIKQTLLASSINTENSRSIRILISSATSVQFLVANEVGYWGDDTKTLNGITLQPHTLYTLCARFKYLGYDSVQKNITISGKNTTYTTSVSYGINPPSALRFGREAAMTGYDFVGEIHGYFCETRYVSDSEAVSRSINPWSLFKPRRRITYIDLGAPAAATLEGHAQAQASATGNLTLAATLDGAALSVVTASGTLTTQIPLAGAAVSVVSATGELLTGIPLSGAAVAQAVAAGSLTAQIRLDGNALAQAAASAGLTSAILLAGNAQGQATATGALAGETSGLAGDAKAEASAVATLTTSIRLSGSAAAQAGVSGILTTQIQLTGAALANAIASGVLSVPILLAGAATAEASASGVLSDTTEPAAPVYYRLTASVQRVTRLACNDAPLAQIQTGARRLTTLTHRVTHV